MSSATGSILSAFWGAAGGAPDWLASMRAGVTVDYRLASFWFGPFIHPQGWALPPAWGAVAGDH